MKRTIKIFALILTVCTMLPMLAACSITPGHEGAPEGMRPINEGNEGAILFVPIDWSVETSTGLPTGYYSSNDRTTVTLAAVPAETLGERDIKSYFESYMESLKNAITDFEIIKEEGVTSDYTTRLIAGQSCYVYTYKGKVAELEYKFRQALLKNPKSGDLYIITFSSEISLFDTHEDEFKEIYDNFKITEETVPVFGKVEIETPSTEGIEIPEGMKLISSVNTDYRFFVKTDWIPTVTTGMTAAHAPGEPAKTVSCAAFNMTSESLDTYWEDFEKDLKNTFGENAIEYESETKFTEKEYGIYKARVYSYSVKMADATYYYSQHILVRTGYIYIVTATADSFDAAKAIDFDISFAD